MRSSLTCRSISFIALGGGFVKLEYVLPSLLPPQSAHCSGVVYVSVVCYVSNVSTEQYVLFRHITLTHMMNEHTYKLTASALSVM